MSGSCLARQPRGTDDVDDLQAAVGGGEGPALIPPALGFTQGALAGYRNASITDGAAGTGVTVHAGDHTVQASVRDGRYVAWWPGPSTGVLTFDLTLADGTVIRDATPHPPALTLALTPAWTPALTPAWTPALTPAWTPALAPAWTPALAPAWTLACSARVDGGRRTAAGSAVLQLAGW
ncbi:hypothetical protein [Dactylosporangium sp. NPDC050588]|uniref:hypothetical protein n=1 Tax=Dactylosporangium sp. NPDC050588 TaxID=3157211 RepID=UPI0033E1CA68